MALVVFLRAVNVGGHNPFRPSILAKELSEYDVVNIGAAGTFVVRKAVSPEKFRSELLNRLPFPAEVMICEGRTLASLAANDPFAGETGFHRNAAPNKSWHAHLQLRWVEILAEHFAHYAVEPA